MSGDAELQKLAALAVEARANFIEAALNVGNVSNWMQRETDAYVAWAGDKWTDEGLAAWVAARQGEMNAAWRQDVATVASETSAPRIEVEAPPASAIREAGRAMHRADERDEEAGPSHMATLLQAILARRGAFVERLEREMFEALASGATDLNAHLAPLLRGSLRDLFRADVEAVIREAEGK
jgi:hypothetical protein